MFLNWTEYCQDHQAEPHEEQQQQDEVLEEQVWREPAVAMLSVLQVLVHTVHQAVGPGAVTQLSAGFVDLERVTHSYAPHLHGRRTQWISVTKLLKVTNTAFHSDTTSDWWLPMVTASSNWSGIKCQHVMHTQWVATVQHKNSLFKRICTIFTELFWTVETNMFIFILTWV